MPNTFLQTRALVLATHLGVWFELVLKLSHESVVLDDCLCFNSVPCVPSNLGCSFPWRCSAYRELGGNDA